MCGGSQVPVSVDREGSDHSNAAVKVGGSLMMKVGNTVVVEDLTAGLVVVVGAAAVAAAAAAFPAALMKCFKLVKIAQRLVHHLPLIECGVGLKKIRYNIL